VSASILFFPFRPFFENVTVRHDGVIHSFSVTTDHSNASRVASLTRVKCVNACLAEEGRKRPKEPEG
jgi:hypothetical protein